MDRKTLAIALAAVWITMSEFARNELLFRGIWEDHYRSLGLVFETAPVNGLLWMVWSLALSYLVYSLLQRMSVARTLVLSWLAAFVMMWLTAYNLQVLPLSILLAAVPLSLLELLIATLIIRKVSD